MGKVKQNLGSFIPINGELPNSPIMKLLILSSNLEIKSSENSVFVGNQSKLAHFLFEYANISSLIKFSSCNSKKMGLCLFFLASTKLFGLPKLTPSSLITFEVKEVPLRGGPITIITLFKNLFTLSLKIAMHPYLVQPMP